MGITEKIIRAKNTKWISEGLSDDEVNAIVKSAKKSVQKNKEIRINNDRNRISKFGNENK